MYFYISFFCFYIGKYILTYLLTYLLSETCILCEFCCEKMWKGYFENLDAEDKDLYKKKLTLHNLEILPDPYSSDGWKDDVSLLPDIGWPDIYHYLIHTPSTFTHESLKAYKSLEAYNLFVSGHVQDVFYHAIEIANDFCCIKSEVNK